MSATNYIHPCSYFQGRFQDNVFLVPDSDDIFISVDDGQAYASGITEVSSVHCTNVSLSHSSSWEGRFSFSQSVSLTLDGRWTTEQLSQFKHFILTDDKHNAWLVNPVLPMTVTYAYTLSEGMDSTVVTIAADSNHPVLFIRNASFSAPAHCNAYSYNSIERVLLNERQYSMLTDSGVTATNGGFKTVRPLSASYTETFNGESVSSSLSITIPMDSYNPSWHYNLLEYEDNTYSALIMMNDGSSLACGFSYGLFPSYSIDTEDDSNTITVTLTENTDQRDSIRVFNTTTPPVVDTATTWVFTSSYGGYECVGVNQARYLLQMEVDANGNQTGRYKCLEGYEERFKQLNIVGTFSETQTFFNEACTSSSGCAFETTIPSNITFTSKACSSFTITTSSKWTITGLPTYITATPSSGDGNASVSICNTSPSSQPSATFQVNHCNGTYYASVKVDIGQSQGGYLINGDHYEIGPTGGWLSIPYEGCIESVTSSTIDEGSINVTRGSIDIWFEPNTTEDKNWTITVKWCDGTTAQATVEQPKAWLEWKVVGTTCYQGDKYVLEALLSGTTSGDVVYETGQTRRGDLILENAPSCLQITPMYEWRASDETYCYNGWLYAVEYEWVSYDGGSTWEKDGRTRLSEDGIGECEEAASYQYRWVLTDLTICGESGYTSDDEMPEPPDTGGTMQYRWVEYSSQCSGTTKMALEKKQYSTNGVNWYDVDPLETRVGRVIEENSTACGYEPPRIERWVDMGTGETICDGYNLCRKQKLQYSYDSGYSWEDADPPQYRPGAILAEDSVQCGYVPTYQYRWVEDSGQTICSGYDKCQRLKRQQSTDGSSWEDVVPAQYSAGTLIEADSVDCGYEPPLANPYKARFALTDGTTGQVECDYDTLLKERDVPSNASAVTFGDCVTIIGTDAFYYNRYLTSLVIPSNVVQIMSTAFWHCDRLTFIRMEGTVPPKLGSTVFDYTTCPIYVPNSAVSRYKSEWDDYADRIEGY